MLLLLLLLLLFVWLFCFSAHCDCCQRCCASVYGLYSTYVCECSSLFHTLFDSLTHSAPACVYPVAIWFAFALFCLIFCLPPYPAAVSPLRPSPPLSHRTSLSLLSRRLFLVINVFSLMLLFHISMFTSSPTYNAVL